MLLPQASNPLRWPEYLSCFSIILGLSAGFRDLSGGMIDRGVFSVLHPFLYLLTSPFLPPHLTAPLFSFLSHFTSPSLLHALSRPLFLISRSFHPFLLRCFHIPSPSFSTSPSLCLSFAATGDRIKWNGKKGERRNRKGKKLREGGSGIIR